MIASSSHEQDEIQDGSPPDEAPPLPSITSLHAKHEEPPRRRPSFSFLHRTRSGERLPNARSLSRAKLLRRQRGAERDHEIPHEHVSQEPPKIPDLPSQIHLETFGGEDQMGDSAPPLSNQSQDYHQNMSTSKDSKNNTGSNLYNVPIPPMPGTPGKAESMTHRGRYSLASSAASPINSPGRVRRRRDPTTLNVLVIGTHGSGKTSFLNFLRTSLALPARKQRPKLQEDIFDANPTALTRTFPNFTPLYLDTEIERERIGLTLWDSQFGLEANMVDLQLREISSFLESKFEDTLNEEIKVFRSAGVRDTHIHCVFLILDPARLDVNLAAARSTPKNKALANGNSFVGPAFSSVIGALEEDLDLQVFRTLKSKTTVVPVIAKADTITSAHMAHLKQAVWDSLKRSNLDPLEVLNLDDANGEPSKGIHSQDHDEIMTNTSPEGQRSDNSQHESPSDTNSSFSASDFDLAKPPWGSGMAPSGSPKPDTTRQPTFETPDLPLSIISPDLYEPDVPGRKFPWGFADPYNATHCDFLRLKEMIFMEWRGELREASRNIWYERWRTARLDRQTETAELVGQAR
ncbi:hypothetical protein MMC29_007399 [Sticta canariensis]|nr:hypothetical protein [Sticta canariensis]